MGLNKWGILSTFMPRRRRSNQPSNEEIRITRGELDQLHRTIEFRERLLRHEQRIRLSSLVSLGSVVLRSQPNISPAKLAELLKIPKIEAASVKHAFGVQTEMRVDRIIERFHAGASMKRVDIQRMLAVDASTAEWLA